MPRRWQSGRETHLLDEIIAGRKTVERHQAQYGVFAIEAQILTRK
jgi:hypothetical protein